MGFALLRRELLKVSGYFQHQNVFNFDFYLRQEIPPGRFEFYTPEDERLEPENTPLEEENHLNQTIIFRIYINPRWCISSYFSREAQGICQWKPTLTATQLPDRCWRAAEFLPSSARVAPEVTRRDPRHVRCRVGNSRFWAIYLAYLWL